MGKRPQKKTNKRKSTKPVGASDASGDLSRPLAVAPNLFDRIVSILEQARGNVVRAVNTNMVLAYWLIGREIVQAIQEGQKRAKYGEQIIEELSVLLTTKYGNGYSKTNLRYFRQFYMSFSERIQIHHPMGGELRADTKLAPTERELGKKNHPAGGDLTVLKKQYPTGTELPQGFSAQLSWSHYRALMRVENRESHAAL